MEAKMEVKMAVCFNSTFTFYGNSETFHFRYYADLKKYIRCDLLWSPIWFPSPINLQNKNRKLFNLHCNFFENCSGHNLQILALLISEPEILTGNFQVLLANVGILTASSMFLTIFHHSNFTLSFFAITFLGLAFLVNQIDETYGAFGFSNSEISSGTIFCLYAHMSHLIFSLSLAGFNFALSTSGVQGWRISTFIFSYWHLVEFVWVVILAIICSF